MNALTHRDSLNRPKSQSEEQQFPIIAFPARKGWDLQMLGSIKLQFLSAGQYFGHLQLFQALLAIPSEGALRDTVQK